MEEEEEEEEEEQVMCLACRTNGRTDRVGGKTTTFVGPADVAVASSLPNKL